MCIRDRGSTTGLWAGATGLSPGTTYYLRVFASTSCNNSNSGYSTSYSFTTSGYGNCITPGAPVSVTATGTGPNTASLDWLAGNPAGSPTVTYFWVVGTSPSVIYGNGVAQGSTTGLWAGATGLSPGTTYYLRVFASTSCNNSNSGYGTSYAFTTSGYGNCITPGAPVSVTAVSYTHLDVYKRQSYDFAMAFWLFLDNFLNRKTQNTCRDLMLSLI